MASQHVVSCNHYTKQDKPFTSQVDGYVDMIFLSITKQDKDSETSSCHICSLICITMYKFIQLPLCCIHLCDNNPKPLFQIAKKNLKFLSPTTRQNSQG